VVAVAVVLATSLSPGRSPAPGRGPGAAPATSAQPPGGFGALPAQSGTPHPGTVSFAVPPGDGPNWILPLAPLQSQFVYNVLDFDYLMWRPLYWADKGVAATIDQALSLAKPPAWSDGGTSVTITMNPGYRWSDGQPVSAQDVALDIELIKAAVKENTQDWALYNPGYFPDDLAGISTPADGTLVLHLTSAVNPGWFFQDVLQGLQPMPAHAWARAAAGGPLLDFRDPANAKKIYDYLAAQSRSTRTWATSRLWQVVDGPYKLVSFDAATGSNTMTANPAYGGPASHQITKLTETVFPSEAAEFGAMRTGAVDVGLVPPGDVTQAASLSSGGYHVFGYPVFGFTYAVYNFKDTTGHFDRIVAQLYFRQAMAHLQDQQGYIRSFMGGAGSQDYGPVPPVPASRYTPGNARDTYPFSVAAAKNLLASHGWKVVPGGTDTCVRPGSGPGTCGEGIPAGTPLTFNLVYHSSLALERQEVSALASAARQAGIVISPQASTLTDIANDNDVYAPQNAAKWAMVDLGGYTQGAYPTTFTVFNSHGGYNAGDYSDPQADELIKASVSGADPDAVKNEAAYLTAQQPGLFEPTADSVYVWKTTLSGPPDSFASLTQYYLTPEAWYFTGLRAGAQRTPSRRATAVTAAAAMTTTRNGALRQASTPPASTPAGRARPAKPCPSVSAVTATRAASSTVAAAWISLSTRGGTLILARSTWPDSRNAYVPAASAAMPARTSAPSFIAGPRRRGPAAPGGLPAGTARRPARSRPRPRPRAASRGRAARGRSGPGSPRGTVRQGRTRRCRGPRCRSARRPRRRPAS
jgi:peptide/nickel transport system substrate-binding protein